MIIEEEKEILEKQIGSYLVKYFSNKDNSDLVKGFEIYYGFFGNRYKLSTHIEKEE